MGQIKKGEERIKLLEIDLGKTDGLKKENKRISNFCGDLRKKCAGLEKEVTDFKSKNTKLEELVVKLNRNLKRIDVIKSRRSLASKENIEKNEALGAKRVVGAARSKAWGELGGGGVCSAYSGFEDDRTGYLQLIEELERRLRDSEVLKVSLQAQLKERVSQWEGLQKEVQEKSLSLLVVEKELRDQSLKVEVLEREVSEGERALKSLGGEFENFKKEAEEKLQRWSESRALQETLELRLHEGEKGVLEKEAAVKELERHKRALSQQLEEANSMLSQSNDKCQSLQRNIDEIARASNALKFEIKQSNEHSQIIMNSLENELKVQRGKCQEAEKDRSRLEEQLGELRALLGAKEDEMALLEKRVKSFKVDAQVNDDMLSEKNEELVKVMKTLREKDLTIERLRKHTRNSERYFEGSKQKLQQLLQERRAEAEEVRKELATLSKKADELKGTLKEKDETMVELSKKNKEMVEEKKRVIEQMGAEMKDILEDFRQEKKCNSSALNELECMKEEKGQLTKKVQEGKKEVDALKVQLADCQKDIIVKMNDNQNLLSVSERLNTQVKILRLNLAGEAKKSNDAREELKGLKKEMLSHRTLLEEYKYESQQNDLKINELNGILTQKTIELEKKNLLLTKMSFDTDETPKEFEAWKKEREVEITNVKNELRNKSEKQKVTEKEVVRLQRIIEKLEQQLAEAAKTNQNLNREMNLCLRTKKNLEQVINNFKSNRASGGPSDERQQGEAGQDEPHESAEDTKDTKDTKDKNSEIAELKELKRTKEEKLDLLERQNKAKKEQLKVDLVDLEAGKCNWEVDFEDFTGSDNVLGALNLHSTNQSDFSLLSCNSAVIDDIFSLKPGSATCIHDNLATDDHFKGTFTHLKTNVNLLS